MKKLLTRFQHWLHQRNVTKLTFLCNELTNVKDDLLLLTAMHQQALRYQNAYITRIVFNLIEESRIKSNRLKLRINHLEEKL